jgi:hypothetical protein
MKTILITLTLIVSNVTGVSENLDYYQATFRIMEVFVKFILGLS